MKIGHICLAPPASEAGDKFAALVEAIARHDVEQHVLVADVAVARCLAHSQRVTVGPVVRTPVMAYCLMPNVEIAHVHESQSGQAGLLLALTRSIPYIITTSNGESGDGNSLARSILQRAAHKVKPADTVPGDEAAREYLNIYRKTLTRIPRGCRPPA